MYKVAVFFTTIIFWIIGFILTSILGALAIISGFIDWTGSTGHQFAHIWGRLLVWISFNRVRVKNKEMLKLVKDPVIYMCSHSSFFDIYIFLGYVLRQFRIVSKEEIFHLPIIGQAMKRMGYISIAATNPKKAAKGLSSSARTIQKGYSVLIYPEGTRSKTGEIQQMRRGSFRFAKEVNVPIMIVRLYRTQEAMPPFQKPVAWVYPGKKMELEYMDIVPAEMVAKLSEKELMQVVYDVMAGNKKVSDYAG